MCLCEKSSTHPNSQFLSSAFLNALTNLAQFTAAGRLLQIREIAIGKILRYDLRETFFYNILSSSISTFRRKLKLYPFEAVRTEILEQ